MPNDPSLWMYFTDASLIVKTVMLLLLAASILSWTIIIQRGLLLYKMRTLFNEFEDQFNNGGDLGKLYATLHNIPNEGVENIFTAGFKEFIRLQKEHQTKEEKREAIERAMRIALYRESEKLESHLPLLATIGSTSPYVGLFGTVWGIMASFHALGTAGQATIAMVAPGISEALIATAMGLFAAIPAVIAYNRYTSSAARLLQNYETFQDEFIGILEKL